eukprot:TsM_000647400 transcript=TsM_000647400 gene=TsM_000647400
MSKAGSSPAPNVGNGSSSGMNSGSNAPPAPDSNVKPSCSPNAALDVQNVIHGSVDNAETRRAPDAFPISNEGGG